MHVLGNDPGPVLRTFIDPKDLPRSYGGELDWKFGDLPVLDDAAKAALGGELPRGPWIFVNGEVRKPSPDGQDLPPPPSAANGQAASHAPTPAPAESPKPSAVSES